MNIYEENKFSKAFCTVWKGGIWNDSFETKQSGYGKQNNIPSIIQQLYSKGRYGECIQYIESIPMFHTNKTYVEYSIKSFISKNDINSAKIIANAYLNEETTRGSVLHKEMVWCNSIFKTIQTNEHLVVDDKCSFQALPALNPDFPKMSNKTELSDDSTHGCTIIARDEIEFGETILLDDLLASVGVAKCAKCFLDSHFKYNCSDCWKVCYCSEQCQEDDIKTHKLECYLIRKLQINDNAQLAVRVFLTGLETDWSRLQVKLINSANIFENVLLVSENFKNHENILDDLAKVCCGLVYRMSRVDMWSTIKTISILDSANTIETLVGQILLRILVVCQMKSVHTLDPVLGMTTQLYTSLILLQTACQPNTIMCRGEDKIILKALKDIPAGTSITYSNFEIINTTYNEVYWDNIDLLNSKCIHSCRCQKDLHKVLYTDSEYIEAVDMPKMLLQIGIQEITQSLKYKYVTNIDRVFEHVNNIKLNNNHLLVQVIYFELIEHTLLSDKLDNIDKYLPIVMNVDNLQYFLRSHISVFALLKNRMVSVFIKSNLPKSVLTTIISYIQFFKKYVYLCFSGEVLLAQIEAIEGIYKVQNYLQKYSWL